MGSIIYLVLIFILVPFVAWAAQREYKCPCCGYKWGKDPGMDEEIARRREAEHKAN